MTKRLTLIAVLIGCLSPSFLTVAQDKDYHRNNEKVTQIAANIEQTIRSTEPKWRLKRSQTESYWSAQRWKSSHGELELRIFVLDSPAEASHTLFSEGVFQISGSEELKGFGEEARCISYPNFTRVGVRKGRLLAAVQGPRWRNGYYQEICSVRAGAT